jgi:hypothetical protein
MAERKEQAISNSMPEKVPERTISPKARQHQPYRLVGTVQIVGRQVLQRIFAAQ